MKQAYPNQDDYISQAYPHNTEKWMAAVRHMYSRVNAGVSRKQALDIATKDFGVVEKTDFGHWLTFYEERAHMKYKTAQRQMFNTENAGYYLPLPSVPPVIPPTDSGPPASQTPSPMSLEEKRKLVELHRKKIIARLQSARKLLTQDNGKMFAGEDWGKLIDSLNELEKQFHTVNKTSLNTTIYNDLIIRRANMFASAGLDQSSEFLIKLAQGLPGAALPSDPNKSGDLGALTNNTPMPLAPPAEVDPNKPGKGMMEFLEGVNGRLGDDDDDDDDDEDENNDDDESDDIEIEEANEVDDELIVEAQVADMPSRVNTLPQDPDPELSPAEVLAPKEPKLTPPKEEVELPEADKPPGDDHSPPNKDFDSLIDAAFANLKVADIVKRLEDLSRIFKNREIARQLSIVDMMMDKLGLSSFFPSLAEATRSALESNQYCLVRIEEVKSRLGGAMNTSGGSLHDMGQQHSINNQQEDSDLVGKESPETDALLGAVKKNLDQQTKKDKLKKELRKNLEETALIGKPEDDGKQSSKVENLENELGGPVKPPVPVAPARVAPTAPARTAPTPPAPPALK